MENDQNLKYMMINILSILEKIFLLVITTYKSKNNTKD